MNNTKRILFTSANNIWGGSEVLWTKSFYALMNKGYAVGMATYYKHDVSHQKVSDDVFINTGKPKLTIKERIIRKALFNNEPVYYQKVIKKFKPELIIHTQGGLGASEEIIKIASEYEIPYIINTQLVGDIHFVNIDSSRGEKLLKLHNGALHSCFVSNQNIELAEKILGGKINTATRIYNPTTVSQSVRPYPTKKTLNIAFVGRLDCYHKGLDVLINVVAQDKWKSRDVFFNLYGDGQHVNQIKNLIEKNKLTNLTLHKHTHDIEQIWLQNHLGIFPSRMEGQSLAMLEAFACGRSVVATNVGGAKEIIDSNTGFLAEGCDVVSLDSALEKAWQNRSEWDTSGKHAHQKFLSSRPHDVVEHFNNLIVQSL